MSREEVGPSLQGQVRFVLRGRLHNGDNPDCSAGAFSARWRGMGIFEVAALSATESTGNWAYTLCGGFECGGGKAGPQASAQVACSGLYASERNDLSIHGQAGFSGSCFLRNETENRVKRRGALLVLIEHVECPNQEVFQGCARRIDRAEPH